MLAERAALLAQVVRTTMASLQAPVADLRAVEGEVEQSFALLLLAWA